MPEADDRDTLMVELAGLFDDNVSASAARIEPCEGSVFEVEGLAVANAVPARRIEFLAGRRCARDALAQLGVPPVAIPAGASRQPLWPHGIVGSISHGGSRCIAVAARRSDGYRGLGVDLEEAGELEPSLVEFICVPAELHRMRDLSADAARAFAKTLFSIKESVFKCQFPMTGVWLEFLDLEVVCAPGDETFEAVLLRDAGGLKRGQRVEGRVRTSAAYVLTSAWLRDDLPDGQNRLVQ